MSSSTTTNPSITVPEATTVNMWERLWRMNGINVVLFFVGAYLVYGSQPKVGASANALVSFYDGDRTRILIAAVIFGLAVLNLMWFAAAIRTTLTEAGRGGWGAAATASSAAVGGVFLVMMAVSAALTSSIGGSGNTGLASGLNDLVWTCFVLSSFPRAMLVMSGSFGLWRAGMISNALFAAGVACVVLGVLGGTTWTSSGFWAPDGSYSRFVWPIIFLVWILVVTRVLSTQRASTREGW
jgi:succinate dehydrogenase/fumarate reductase cytochrome b subunit